jgi:hypothetical protein
VTGRRCRFAWPLRDIARACICAAVLVVVFAAYCHLALGQP